MSFPTLFKIAVKPLYGRIELQLNQNNSIELKRGSDANLIKDLAESIGFDYVIYTPDDDQWGKKQSNGSWTGALGMLDRGEVDMTVAPMTKDNYDSFTMIPFTLNEIGFATNKPSLKSIISKFDLPFQSEVWIACIASFLAIALMLWFTSRKNYSFFDAVTKSLKILLRQDFTMRRRSSIAIRTVVSCWMVTSMFLTSSYSAVLLSSMTLPVRDQGIRTVDELSEAVLNRDYKFLYAEGTTGLEFISSIPKLKGVAEKMRKNNWSYQFVNGSLPQNLDSKTAIYGTKTGFRLNYGVEPHSSKVISIDSITVLHWGLAVRKQFCCTKSLQKYISRISAAGMYEEYTRKVLIQSSPELSTASEDEHIRSLSVTDLRKVFIFSLFGVFSAFSVLIIEILIFKYTKFVETNNWKQDR